MFLERVVRDIWLLPIILMVLRVSHAGQATYAERLGWPAGLEL